MDANERKSWREEFDRRGTALKREWDREDRAFRLCFTRLERRLDRIVKGKLHLSNNDERTTTNDERP